MPLIPTPGLCRPRSGCRWWCRIGCRRGRHNRGLGLSMAFSVSREGKAVVTKPCWARVSGPLEPYAVGCRTELERLGYTPLTAAAHIRLVAQLSRWMTVRDVAVSGLTVAVVDAYFT